VVMAPAAVAPEAVTRAAVMHALAGVADPEIPNVSIVDLGMIGAVDVSPDRIDVELLPTFVGCPALELIRTAIADALASFGRPVDVQVSFATPWSTDRITDAGREALRRSGFAPPATAFAVAPGRGLPMLDDAPVACPHCGSLRTTLENAFGPTLCRSIRHCADCRQPFEAFKAL
jgi:ring-1,2-phenylacetyl-CoA epoxidase subunit PaaD